ncbi:DUF4872 domain-containing protein, partial [Nocardia abscessus]|uniref:DUF4872 domain-containing protein n=1 Tax=Nocardia abscessus TaxID=120957 RepID=UPI0024577BE6
FTYFHYANVVYTYHLGVRFSTCLTRRAGARAARAPMTAAHRSFTLNAARNLSLTRGQIISAITACADAFLNPPIGNLGYRGIEKGGKLVRTWLQRTGNPQRDLPQAALLMEKAGTGGALFRNLYRDFLAECTELFDSRHLRAGHELYIEAAILWTEVAALITKAGESGNAQCLVQAGALLCDLSRIEREAMEALSCLGGDTASPIQS